MASNVLIGIVTVLVAGVIGFAILDSITTDTIYYDWAINESHTVATNTSSFNVSFVPVILNSHVLQGNDSASCTNMVNGTNYTVNNLNYGQFTLTDYADGVCGLTIRATYSYQDAEYFDSAISRTIVQYIVPIGLIGILAAAVVLV